MKCEKCGNELEPNVTFCNKCGNQVSASSIPVVEKKKKNGLKVVLIIILLIVFLGAGIGIGLLLGKNRNKCLAPERFSETKKDDEETKEEKDKKDNNTGSGDKKHEKLDVTKIKTSGEDEYGKNIEILKFYYPEDGTDLYVLAKNNNKIAIDYTFYLNYLDEKGTRVDRGLSMGYVEAGKTFVVKIYNSTSDDFKSVSVSTSARAYKSYYHSVDVEKKVETKESSKGIDVSYKNDTDKDVSIYLSIIYYKNNEIFFFDTTTLIVKPGLTENTSFYSYALPGYSYGVTPSSLYDKYEVLVDAGFSYDTDY